MEQCFYPPAAAADAPELELKEKLSDAEGLSVVFHDLTCTMGDTEVLHAVSGSMGFGVTAIMGPSG
eukprot:CAMPEP_0119263244 /NCGR_PEP_ID=MMETSP1329-20130426/2707_1 /TAXON_ID=114041 /ORGANISM="Genus nov. species nov., Strain RCC1024" /LENGTH=65 /DNA_ID=CAMNT_0007262943 /DNA_START=21 /DNA_END=215 /DNA_ORIENTATION=+